VTGHRGPAVRAVGRWSVRLFRREWRQQVLVVVLLAVAVAAAVAFATVAVNGSSAVNEPFGGANTRITIDASDPALAQQAITEAAGRFGTVDDTAHRLITVPGTIHRLDLRDQDPDGPYSARLLDLRAGRYPTGPSEVALTDAAVDLLGGQLGAEVTVDGNQVSVVGLVENPAELSDEFVLVAPGTLTDAEQHTLLVDTTTERRGPADGMGFQMEVLGNDVDEAAIAAGVLAATTLGLALVGLLAAAAFLVVAHRRRRQLALLVAVGATARQVRLVMLSTGAITGAVAAVAGLALGVVAWVVAVPAVETAADHRIDRAQLPWALLVAVCLLAVVVATLAAWWPARTASRLPVVAALRGRPAPPRPVHRPLVVAVALVAGGAAAIATADPTGTSREVRPVVFVGGLLAVVLGTVLAAPGAVRLGGRLARRLPFAPRVALRDLARYQARAAAALGAITLALAVSFGVVAVAAAAEPAPDEGELSDRELLVLVGDPTTAPRAELTSDEVAALDQRAAAVIATLGDDVPTAPLDVAMSTRPPTDATPRHPVELALSRGRQSFEGRGVAYVATPDLLDLYGIEPESVDPGVELLTSRHEPFVLLDVTDLPRQGLAPAAAEVVDLPTHESAPSALITEEAMDRHGWVPARAGWVVESASPLTSEQIQAAQQAAAEVGLAVEVRSPHDELDALRTGAMAAGGVLAAVIVAVAVGLIRSEAGRDLRTLTATGASGRTRRALTASTAVGLAVPGVVLALTGAYLALVASYRADLGRLLPVPVEQLVPLALGIPLVTAAVGWLFAGREPRAFARQDLE
jgi:putative ABC transport system permease protein